MAHNVIPEEVKVGIVKEATRGLYPSSAPILLPVEPPTLSSEIDTILDENMRGVPARDFAVYGGMRKVTGSLSGNFYGGSTDDEVTTASPLGHLMRAFFGGAEAAQIGATGWYAHNFYTVSDPGTVTLQVEDTLTDITTSAAATQASLRTGLMAYVGCMFTKLMIKWDANDGMLMWDADVLGARGLYLNTATNPVGVLIGTDKTSEATLGWGASVAFGSRAQNPAHVSGKLLSGEITFEREIELKVGAGNQNFPDIYAARPTRVTFTVVMELNTDYSDLHKYVFDRPGGIHTQANYKDFTDTEEAWSFRFVNQSDFANPVTTVTTDAQIGATTGTSPANLMVGNDSVFDIRMHNVSLGDSPITIARDALANTIELTARALYVPGPTLTAGTWFGADPGSAAQTGSPVAQVRLINNKDSVY